MSVLVNNASIFETSTVAGFSGSSFDRHMNINLKAPMILTREFAAACRRGHVINILDTHITSNKTDHATYLLSKKGLAELTKMAAVEFSPRVRVNAVAPGLILPPAGKSTKHLERLAKDVPLKRKGSLGNITRTVEFLINNDYVNGQIIFNDGGEHLL